MDISSNLSLPETWPALCLLVFTLGLRHGFDADHLATIDGLTRYNATRRPGLARWCGTLFSVGHGVVVMAIALGVSLVAQAGPVPHWLEDFGTGVSVFFLVFLGVANLRAVLVTPKGEIVRPVGCKGRWLGRLARTQHPVLVALVGALFALSFDTLSQASLFALLGCRYGGWDHALLLGLIFMVGMLVTDGINGYWVARLIRRADRLALVASRVMGLAVGLLSLGVAAFALAKRSLPTVEAWSEGKEILVGAAVVLVVIGSFWWGRRLAGRGVLAGAD